MTKPKKQTPSMPSDYQIALAIIERSQAALRAALAVMEDSDVADRKRENHCSQCDEFLYGFDGEYVMGHSPNCRRVFAIRLVREALGEKV